MNMDVCIITISNPNLIMHCNNIAISRSSATT